MLLVSLTDSMIRRAASSIDICIHPVDVFQFPDSISECTDIHEALPNHFVSLGLCVDDDAQLRVWKPSDCTINFVVYLFQRLHRLFEWER
jgi:hypothetical protein